MGWCASHTQPNGAGERERGGTLGAGGPKAHQRGAPPPPPLPWPPHLPIWRAAAPPRVGTLGVAPPPPPPIYSGGFWAVVRHSFPSPSAQPCSSSSSSLPVLGEALPGDLVSPSTPRRRAAGVLPQPLPPPCWIKVRETSPGCTCVERGGAVVRH